MEEREITLKELFSVVWKQKYILGLVFILGLVAFGIGGFVYNNSNEQMVTYVSLQWDGIGQGEYPNGERFDYTEAVEPYVIQLAIDGESLELEVTDVRDALSLTPIVPTDIQSVIATALENGEQISYYATDYKVSLDYKDLEISENDARSLIEQLIIEFRNDFEKKYINQSIILDYTGVDFVNLEYVDIAGILNTQIDLIQSRMNLGLSSDANFYSANGITFADIIVRTNLLETVEINQINTRTVSYLLSKDPTYLATYYQYKIDLLQLNLNKEESKELDVQEAITNYAGNLTQIVIPGVDQELIIDTYYDVLLQELFTIQANIAEYENDILYYEQQINRLEGNDAEFNANVTAQKQEDEKLVVEENIASAQEKLGTIVFDANELLVEYNEYLTSNIIKPLMSPVIESGGLSTAIIALIGAVLSTGVATLTVLFKNEWN